LRNARSRSLAKLAEAREALKDFDSEDTSIIVSGSLARDEYTDDSDFDWSLLIDGVCDPGHHRVVREIRSRVAKLTNKPPGPERTFGDMVFSHDLVHHIGGEDDTNRNTTQRLLLVLESRVVGRTEAHARVRRNVLNRYLLEDRGFWREQSRFRVPRFLQNDLARYWRTVAVDFSYKRRNRGGEGWAIRNLKLRMSRKLVYVAGLLACYRCHMDSNPERRGKFFEEPNSKQQVISRLEQVFNMTPLENIAEALLRFPHLYGPARQIFDSYDGFVGVLSDSDKRRHLELLAEDGDSDELYQSARALSHTFRDGLLEFFFDPESEMEILTKNFGVF
jgi:predicted nucleotidyltransferase